MLYKGNNNFDFIKRSMLIRKLHIKRIGDFSKMIFAFLFFVQGAYAQSDELANLRLYAQKGSDTTKVLLNKIKPSIDFKNGNDLALEYLLIKYKYHVEFDNEESTFNALKQSKIHYEHSTDDKLKLEYEMALYESDEFELIDRESLIRKNLKKAENKNLPEYVVDANILLFRIFRRQVVKDSMNYYLDEGLRVAKKNKLHLKEARILRIKGILARLQSNYSEAMKLLDQSLEIYNKYGFEIYAAKNLTYKARIYHDKGLYEEALKLYHKSILIYEKYDAQLLVKINNRYLGLINQDLDRHEEAIKEFKKAKLGLSDTVHPFIASRIYIDLGNSYAALGKFDEAEFSMKKGIKLKESVDDNIVLPDSYNSLGNLYLKEVKLDSAKIQFEKAIFLNEKLQTTNSLAESHLGLSRLFLEKNKLKLAKKNGELALNYANKKEAIETKFSTLLVLAEIASKNKNSAKANQYYQASVNLQDSVMNFQKALKVNNIIMAYDNQKRELEVLNLKYENQENTTKLQQNELRTRLYLLGFIAVVVTFLLLLRSFLQSKKAAKKQRLLNDWLNQNNRKLSESNEQLEQFAQMASHDLKSPLTTINLYSSLLETNTKAKIGEKERRYVQGIAKSGKNLVTMIDDMLNYSKIGANTLNLEITDLDKMVKDVVTSILGCALENEVELKQLRPFPNSVLVDEVKLKRVFQNIIANAIKFKDVTKTSNYVHLDYEELDGSHRFTITDNGIGIPKSSRNIFRPFTHLDQKVEYEGTGIGLSICEKIIAKHGGEIWYESEPDRGTSFYFTIAAEADLDKSERFVKTSEDVGEMSLQS